MLLDGNMLIYAVDSDSSYNERARLWMEDALNGPRRVGFPWMSIVAFVRIATNPRALRAPLTGSAAWRYVEDWLAAPASWIPLPGAGYGEIFGRLVTELDLRGNLVADAAVAALAVEHGASIVSADSDFARFSGIEWINPFR